MFFAVAIGFLATLPAIFADRARLVSRHRPGGPSRGPQVMAPDRGRRARRLSIARSGSWRRSPIPASDQHAGADDRRRAGPTPDRSPPATSAPTVETAGPPAEPRSSARRAAAMPARRSARAACRRGASRGGGRPVPTTSGTCAYATGAQAERLLEEDLPRRGEEEVLPADHARDAVVRVVEHDRELVAGENLVVGPRGRSRSRRSPRRRRCPAARRRGRRTRRHLRERGTAARRDVPAGRAPRSTGQAEAPARARIAEIAGSLVRRALRLLDVLPRAGARIDGARSETRSAIAARWRSARDGLDRRFAVPVEAEPREVLRSSSTAPGFLRGESRSSIRRRIAAPAAPGPTTT